MYKTFFAHTARQNTITNVKWAKGLDDINIPMSKIIKMFRHANHPSPISSLTNYTDGYFYCDTDAVIELMSFGFIQTTFVFITK